MKTTTVILKKIAGILLMVYGIIALATPFTPGFWLLFIGAELLGIQLLILEKPISYIEDKIGGKHLKWFKKQTRKFKNPQP